MATLSYSDILPKKIVMHNGEPCVVLSAHVFRKQQRKPVNQTKLKGLKSGKVIEQTFHQNETAVEADIDRKPIVFIYKNRGVYTCTPPETPSERFTITEDVVGPEGQFLKEGSVVEALFHDDEIIGITIPIKVDLEVTEAPPAVKGNTAQGATKEVTLETGATLQVPMFINQSDIVRVNTDTASYAERVEKA